MRTAAPVLLFPRCALWAGGFELCESGSVWLSLGDGAHLVLNCSPRLALREGGFILSAGSWVWEPEGVER